MAEWSNVRRSVNQEVIENFLYSYFHDFFVNIHRTLQWNQKCTSNVWITALGEKKKSRSA